MVRTACLVLLLGFCVPALAQQPIMFPGTRPADSTYKQFLYGSLARRILIDSLNHRYAPLQQEESLLTGRPDTGLNNTARNALLSYVQQTSGASHLHSLQQQAAVLKDSARLRSYLDKKLRGFYALQDPLPILPSMRKIALDNQFQGAGVTAFYDNSGSSVIQSGYTAQLSDEAVVANIPFHINYTNISGHSAFQPGYSDQSLTKISFDKDAYRKRLEGLVNQHYDLRKYFLQDVNVGDALRTYAGNDLRNITQRMDSLYHVAGRGGIGNVISPDQLFYLDSAQLRNAVKQRLPDGDSLQERISDDYLQQLYALKKQYGNKAPQDLLHVQNNTNGKITQWMQEEGQQAETDKTLLPLNFVQKLMLKAQSLNIGNFAAGGSAGTVSGLFMKGAQGTFLGKNDKSFMLGAGTRQDFSTLKDAPFSNSLEGSGYMMEMLQLGKGMPDQPHSLVGAVNANSKNTNMSQFSTMALPRNIFVGTFSKSMHVGSYGTLDVDLGKSANTFSNATTGSDYASAGKAAALTLMNDFWQTFSAGLDFNGMVDEWNLSHREYISYSGMSYNNPAAPFGTRGSIRYGINLKRSWYRNKLVIGIKTDQRTIHNSPDGSDAWRNQQYSVDARYKLDRNFSLSARISQSTMKNTASTDHSNDFVTRQVSVSSQASTHWWGIAQSSNVTMGMQQMNVGSLKSLLLNVNLNHNVVLNSNVVSLNVFYNKDVKDNALYGNMFNAEAIYNYTLLKSLSCGSGITYLSDLPVVRQAGLKQTLTAILSQRLSTSLYLDCRRNLHNTPQNYLYGTFHSEVALHYAF
ncbi:hypothetical protein GA0116948_1262 [Chitinophaga costaii]|uniref:Uncharacterized protein n=1 Tax=Chitinophaga costaii TaxID=1335309 RepID=A0A1C4G783_9BACT|nr:hypothetical protein [Chitinophaga costaii]SCC64016.1 hypothetical protein GA0116948_1262 [Chitinophaga costaii]